jgi:hypothetical protein
MTLAPELVHEATQPKEAEPKQAHDPWRPRIPLETHRAQKTTPEDIVLDTNARAALVAVRAHVPRDLVAIRDLVQGPLLLEATDVTHCSSLCRHEFEIREAAFLGLL